MYSEEITGIVIDIGSQTIRSGFSGEDCPKFVMPSAIEVLEQDISLDQNLENNFQQKSTMEIEQNLNQTFDQKGQNVGQQEGVSGKQKVYYVGNNLLTNPRAGMKLYETNRQGQIFDWDAMEKVLKEVYANYLKVTPQEYPLLMSEYSLQQNSSQREKLCELAFESLHVNNFFLCKQACLSSFASGRSTSLILDSGASGTICVPVHDGYALQKGIFKSSIGGNYLNDVLLQSLTQQLKRNILPRYHYKVNVDKDLKKSYEQVNFDYQIDPQFEKYFQLEIMRDIKEHVFKIVDDIPKKDSQQDNIEYELPDGTVIQVDDIRYTIPDLLFQSITYQNVNDSYTFQGIQNMIMDSINNCDVDIKKEFLQNVIICGGNSCIPGYYEKLSKKMIEIAPQSLKVKIIVHPQQIERKYSSWIGGSILASLGSFQNLWVNRQEYDEIGSYIIEKKCP